jgi:L-alanine-DL-glutamate epimerase-like enolase superfamily enzyme
MVAIAEIRNAVVPIRSDIANAYIDFSTMTASVVAVISDVVRDGKPVIGYGFNSNGRYACKGLLEERFVPRLAAADLGGAIDPHRAWDAMMTGEKPGGHGERSVAVGVLDMALWDLAAKLEDVPLRALIARRHGRAPETDVFVYAAGGYYRPGKDVARLVEELEGYKALGYEVCKIKIGGAPGEAGDPLPGDLRRIEAALEVTGPGNLAVDANGRFDLETAVRYAEALRGHPLFWFEEAGDPLDYALQAALAEVYPGPMATGENLFSRQDARNLLRHGGMRPDRDWLQFDPALAYGLVEYERILAMLPAHGFSARNCIPHGGHQMALNIAAGLGLGGNESYPEVFRPFGGFADGTPVEGGRVALPDAPGVGFETKAGLIASLRAATGT